MRLLSILFAFFIFHSTTAQTKRILLERYNTTTSPFTPDAEVFADELRENYGVIDVSIHSGYKSNGDAMNNSDGNNILSKFSTQGFPSGMVNRYEGDDGVVISREKWKNYAISEKKLRAKVAVSIQHTYDESTRELEYNVSTLFYETLSPEVRGFVYLVEDSVIGTGSGYDQSNFYDKIAGHRYHGKGNPIKDFYHRNVLRQNMTGVHGISLGTNNAMNSAKSFSGKLTVPSGYNHKQLHLVAFVSYYSSSTAEGNEILNVAKAAVLPECKVNFGANVKGKTVQFWQSSTGATSQKWLFGDGNTSTDALPKHTYELGGTYAVTLQIFRSGKLCNSTTKEIIIPYGCEADFSFSAYKLKVDFTNTTSGDSSGGQWDFGDGNVSRLPNPSHTYSSEGMKKVVLIVYDPDGEVCDTVSKRFRVHKDLQCAPSFTYGIEKLTVDFTNTSTGPFKTVKWDFGDGNSSTDEKPSHTYKEKGTYSVCLSLFDQDNEGCGEQYCLELKVGDAMSVSENLSYQVQLFPNPTTGLVTFQSITAVEYLDVLNSMGQLVHTERVYAPKGSLDLSNLPKGTYLVQTRTSTTTTVQRLLLVR